jgi:hypothetical protein
MEKLFWNKEKTRGSFDLLHKLAKEVDFVLIGGWAVYFYVRQQESLDVDIAIRYDKIDYFKRFGVSQYESMKIKYSIIDNIYVDMFLTEFSDKELPIPVSKILKNYIKIDGVKVVEKEMLLLLKLWGYFRNDEVKVRKDIIDVISLLFYGDVDLYRFKNLVKSCGVEKRRSTDVLLEYLDKGETLLEYIGIDGKEYAARRKEYKNRINEIS